MSGSYGLTGTVALSAAATTYLWGVVSGAAAGDGVMIAIDTTFDAAAAAQGIKLELFRSTANIPSATSYTINKLSSDAQTTPGIASAWVTPITVTPSGITVIKTWYVGPTGGLLYQYPLAREDYIIAGTTNWIGLRVTTPTGVTCNCAYNASWNE